MKLTRNSEKDPWKTCLVGGKVKSNSLSEALENNDHLDQWKSLEVLATIEGQNDGESWHWIVKDQDGGYWYLTGWCDMTGWDCQSGLKYFGPYKSTRGVLKEVPELDNDDRRPRELLERALHNQLFSEKMENEVLNNEEAKRD